LAGATEMTFNNLQ